MADWYIPVRFHIVGLIAKRNTSFPSVTSAPKQKQNPESRKLKNQSHTHKKRVKTSRPTLRFLCVMDGERESKRHQNNCFFLLLLFLIKCSIIAFHAKVCVFILITVVLGPCNSTNSGNLPPLTYHVTLSTKVRTNSLGCKSLCFYCFI